MILCGSVVLNTQCCVSTRAADPDSLNPDPAFQVNMDTDPGFWWPKTEEKKLQLKNCFTFNWSKIVIYSCPSYRRNLQPSKKNIQHFKKWNLLTFFYVCALLDPNWIRIHNTGQHTRFQWSYDWRPEKQWNETFHRHHKIRLKLF